jgi:hypothetical protein
MTPLLLALLLVVVLGGGLAAFALGPDRRRIEAAKPVAEAPRSQFFLLSQQPAESARDISNELLLARVEQYVRQERAAVEHFPDRPRAEDLRGRAPARLN